MQSCARRLLSVSRSAQRRKRSQSAADNRRLTGRVSPPGGCDQKLRRQPKHRPPLFGGLFHGRPRVIAGRGLLCPVARSCFSARRRLKRARLEEARETKSLTKGRAKPLGEDSRSSVRSRVQKTTRVRGDDLSFSRWRRFKSMGREIEPTPPPVIHRSHGPTLQPRQLPEDDYLIAISTHTRQRARRLLISGNRYDADDIAQDIVLECVASLRCGVMVRRRVRDFLRIRARRDARDADYLNTASDDVSSWIRPECRARTRGARDGNRSCNRRTAAGPPPRLPDGPPRRRVDSRRRFGAPDIAHGRPPTSGKRAATSPQRARRVPWRARSAPSANQTGDDSCIN